MEGWSLIALEVHQLNLVRPILRGAELVEQHVLQDVEFSVDTGNIAALLGPSGSGKSTTLRLINRLDEPTSGRVLLFGQDALAMDVRELRRRVGFVSQIPAVLPGTVAHNICFGPSLRGNQCDARHFIKLVGLDADLLERPADALSVGQQQRVCIARALAVKPDVVLLDEPTAALDSSAANTLLNLVSQLNRELGLTVIMVTHALEHAKAVAHQVVLLNEGRVIEASDAAEFFSRPATEEGLWFLKGGMVQDGR